MGATWSVAGASDGTVRVLVSGEIDLAAEEPFVEQVDALLKDAPEGRIDLDLADVVFIDSSGVRALIRVHQAHGDRVRLVEVPHPVRRVLDIAGLTERLGAAPERRE